MFFHPGMRGLQEAENPCMYKTCVEATAKIQRFVFS